MESRTTSTLVKASSTADGSAANAERVGVDIRKVGMAKVVASTPKASLRSTEEEEEADVVVRGLAGAGEGRRKDEAVEAARARTRRSRPWRRWHI